MPKFTILNGLRLTCSLWMLVISSAALAQDGSIEIAFMEHYADGALPAFDVTAKLSGATLSGSERETMSDSNGVLVFQGLPAGVYTIEATSPTTTPETFTGLRDTDSESNAEKADAKAEAPE